MGRLIEDQIKGIETEEIIFANLYVQNALINLLSEKGILTKKDILEEVKNQLRSDDKQGA